MLVPCHSLQKDAKQSAARKALELLQEKELL